MAVILITGGARSGKSTRAEALARSFPAQPPIYIATAEAHDAEMEARIARHRARRIGWIEREVPLDLVPALHATDGGGARLVDCLTLWLSNLMHAGRNWKDEVDTLATAVPDLKSPLIFVTNEVGLGIVPDNALARSFRDAAGIMNQVVADVADKVEFVVAGLPMKLK